MHRRYKPRIQHAAQAEVHGARGIGHQEDDRGKGNAGAAHGKGHIQLACIPGPAVHGMHHQRQRGQRQALVEEKQRDGIGRQRNAHGDAKAHEVEREETHLGALMLHILKGIDRGGNPHQRGHGAENPA